MLPSAPVRSARAYVAFAELIEGALSLGELSGTTHRVFKEALGARGFPAMMTAHDDGMGGGTGGEAEQGPAGGARVAVSGHRPRDGRPLVEQAGTGTSGGGRTRITCSRMPFYEGHWCDPTMGYRLPNPAVLVFRGDAEGEGFEVGGGDIVDFMTEADRRGYLWENRLERGNPWRPNN